MISAAYWMLFIVQLGGSNDTPTHRSGRRSTADLQDLITGLKGILEKDPGQEHAPVLEKTIASLEAGRVGLRRLHAKPLEACVGDG